MDPNEVLRIMREESAALQYVLERTDEPGEIGVRAQALADAVQALDEWLRSPVKGGKGGFLPTEWQRA